MHNPRRNFFRAAGAIAIAALSHPLAAHHSFSAMYDAKKPIRLKGRLRNIRWTNPHAWFELEVPAKNGELTIWRCEGAAPGILTSRGLKKADIKPGDILVVDGYLARSGAHIVDARRITLPDGRRIDGGSSGDGGPGSKSGEQPAAS